MKKLLILRHAQALGTEVGGTDKTRKLSPTGQADALALGKAMKRDGLMPDLVLCSTATRTSETLDGVLQGLDVPHDALNIEYSDRLYNADYPSLIHAVQQVDDEIDTILVVAHNPGIHQFAAQMAAEDGSDRVDRLSMGYAPATMTVLECDLSAWQDLQDFSNSVVGIYETSEYNASDRPTRWM